jgi:hypothetical protein
LGSITSGIAGMIFLRTGAMNMVARRTRDMLIVATLVVILWLIYAAVINHFVSDGIQGVTIFAAIFGTLITISHVAIKVGRNIISIVSSSLGIFIILAYVGLTVGLIIEESQSRVIGNGPPPPPPLVH